MRLGPGPACAQTSINSSPPVGSAPPAGSVAPVDAGPRHDRLPQRLTSVIGRQDDIRLILAQLADARLVTLTGPGGVGKTTLALECGRRAGADLPPPVPVLLAALVPGADLADAFAIQLGLAVSGPGEPAAAALAAHLSRTPALLVVDNCEHVVDDAAVLIERLLQTCPALRVLATSREALAVAGEVQVAVAPLAVPDDDADVDGIGQAAAVRLFLDRARAARPGFTLDAANAPVVADICRQLDGIPLAVELAAARIKALAPADIAARLRDRFTLLTGGPRTSDARHRTLRATLDWSYDLLTEEERTLLRRLTVFRGGWSLPAAEDVCGFGELTPDAVADVLLRLVDRSLVVAEPDTGRFRLLVMVREYAAARLAGDEDRTCRDRHRDHMIRFVEEYGPRVRFGEGDTRHAPGAGRNAARRLDEESGNVHAAVEHALTDAATDPQPALRLTTALTWYWQYGHRYEGVRALTALLDAAGDVPAVRAAALQGIGLLHVYYPTPASRAAARESLALYERLGDPVNIAKARLVVAWEGQYGGDAETFREMIARSRAELGDAEQGWWSSNAYYLDGLLDLRCGDFDRARSDWPRALELARRAGDTVIVGAVLAHLGIALRGAGCHAEAIEVLRAAVADARHAGSPHGLAFALVHLAHTLLDAGAAPVVDDLLAEAHATARTVRNPRCEAWAAWGRARIAYAHGDAATATRDCRTAVDLLGDREFPWARAALWSLLAQAADAAGDPDVAGQARREAQAAATQ